MQLGNLLGGSHCDDNTELPSVQQEHMESLLDNAQNLTDGRLDEPEDSYVTAISREELNRIGRFAGTSVLLLIGMKYGVADLPPQQAPDGKELPSETMTINTLKQKLDAEQLQVTNGINSVPPRFVLTDLLKEHHPSYACILPTKKEDKFFNIELVEVALRLVMRDVHPFAVALGIEERVLSRYKPKFEAKEYRRGTTKILRSLRIDDRLEIVEKLKKYGYPEEAKALYFGFEIGLGDVVEVENRVDQAQLAQQLGVLDDNEGSSQNNGTVGDDCRSSFLVRWKDSVRPSNFNQRWELTDALFNMGEKEIALDVMSGKYRKGAINNSRAVLLGKTISVEQLPTLCKLLNQRYREGKTSQEVITTWASDEKFFKILDKSPITLSNDLLEAGFYAFAHEIMAGAWRQKEKKKAAPEERKEMVGTVIEKRPHGGSSASGETVDCTDVEKVESATGVESAETEQNVKITGGKPREDHVGSQDGEGQSVTGGDADDSHNTAVEVDKQGNSTECDAIDEWVIVNQEDMAQDDESQESSQDDTQNDDNQERKTQANEDGCRPGESDISGKESETPVTSATELSSWTKSEPKTIARAMIRL